FAAAWILAFAPLFYVLVTVQERERARWLAAGGARRAVPVAALLLVILAAHVLLSAGRFLWLGERAREPMADPTSFGILIYLGLIPWLHQRLARREATLRADLLLAAVAYTGVLVAAATASRAVIALLGAAVLGWLLFAAWGRLARRGAVLVLLAALAAYGTVSLMSGAMREAVQQDLASDTALAQRAQLLDATLDLVPQSLPHGIGLYGFVLRYPAVRNVEDQTSAGRFVHNDYLQLLLEGGLWLAVPLFAFILAVALLAVAALRASADFSKSDRASARASADFSKSDRASARASADFLKSDRASSRTRLWRRAGGVVALGCVLAHAAVTYVFYTLAVAAAIGAVAGWVTAGRPASVEAEATVSARARWVWWLGVLLALYGMVLLVLDNLTLGVFSGQPSLPGVAKVRTSADRQVEFARLAARLNGDRSTPLVVQAVHLKRLLQEDPAAGLYPATVAAFDKALAANPFSVQTRIAYADLLARTGAGTGDVEAGVVAAQSMLRQGLALNPASWRLLTAQQRLLDATRSPAESYAFARASLAPWLGLFAISRPADARAAAQDLIQRASTLGQETDITGYEAALRNIERRLAAPRPPPVRLMRWRARAEADSTESGRASSRAEADSTESGRASSRAEADGP
ncbi:MAG: O-antigen ligase family protein, partial [Pseudomonadota bacterium]